MRNTYLTTPSKPFAAVIVIAFLFGSLAAISVWTVNARSGSRPATVPVSKPASSLTLRISPADNPHGPVQIVARRTLPDSVNGKSNWSYQYGLQAINGSTPECVEGASPPAAHSFAPSAA